MGMEMPVDYPSEKLPLSEVEVLYLEQGYTRVELAERFGVTENQINYFLAKHDVYKTIHGQLQAGVLSVSAE